MQRTVTVNEKGYKKLLAFGYVEVHDTLPVFADDNFTQIGEEVIRGMRSPNGNMVGNSAEGQQLCFDYVPGTTRFLKEIQANGIPVVFS